jgi:uncharacterized membrane protein
MKTVGRLLAKGLLTILPIVLTVYFIYWLGVTTESLLSGLLKVWLPAEIYIPGMGLVAGFVVLIVIGLLVNAYVVRRVITFSESLILRIPVVKTVYSAVRDLTGLMKMGEKSGELQRVVMVQFGPGKVIGGACRGLYADELPDWRLHSLPAPRPYRADRPYGRSGHAYRADRRYPDSIASLEV